MNDGARDQLILGDCLEALPLLPASSVHLVLADLPYAATRNAWDSLLPLDVLWREWERVLVPDGAVVLTATMPFMALLYASKPRWYRHDWVWESSIATGHLSARVAPLRCHEHVLVFAPKRLTYNPQFWRGQAWKRSKTLVDSTPNYGRFVTPSGESDGSKMFPRSVVYIPDEQRRDGERHPTQKPVALFRYLIRTYTEPGQVVLDPTIGSGTTAVACVYEGRHFVGIERDETYFSTAERRIAEVRAQPHLFAAPSLDAGTVQQKNEMVSLFGNEEGVG